MPGFPDDLDAQLRRLLAPPMPIFADPPPRTGPEQEALIVGTVDEHGQTAGQVLCPCGKTSRPSTWTLEEGGRAVVHRCGRRFPILSGASAFGVRTLIVADHDSLPVDLPAGEVHDDSPPLPDTAFGTAEGTTPEEADRATPRTTRRRRDR